MTTPVAKGAKGGGAWAHFIEQEDVPRGHQTHDELDASPLAIGDLVHMPVQVDVEDAEEPIAPLLVSVAANRIQETGHDDVRTHDWIRCPFRSEERHTLDGGESRGVGVQSEVYPLCTRYVPLVIGGKHRGRGSRPFRP